MANSICDPFTNLPVKFDIDQLIKEFKPEVQKQDIYEAKGPRNFLHLPCKDWTILPRFEYQLEHLKTSLSCRLSQYLRCRYTKFLDNVPQNYVTIATYGSNVNRMPKPRRKTLNGQFYGVDNKLAPIPVLADPRQHHATKIKRK
ncbi:uncharacterized protein [Drosophila pseudoobscura]|uniref:Uncharacterized protein n=1 Tax=Drosophila pseudoobscura pseudoobscura TaxID=46245 RepID=A0A6I8V1Q2_DROPS|nr:uncharacterized protein LOC6896713 [Drosophila pseudoobscura]